MVDLGEEEQGVLHRVQLLNQDAAHIRSGSYSLTARTPPPQSAASTDYSNNLDDVTFFSLGKSDSGSFSPVV